jgi:hypothetical protein
MPTTLGATTDNANRTIGERNALLPNDFHAHMVHAQRKGPPLHLWTTTSSSAPCGQRPEGNPPTHRKHTAYALSPLTRRSPGAGPPNG